MKKVVIILILLGMVSCKTGKEPATTEDPYEVEKLSTLSAEDINQKYSDANIKEDSGVFEEGTVTRHYQVLYPGTPDELQITWADENRTKIYDIRFTEDGKWHSAEGIKIGTSYDELNRLNGKPISFYGFGWDYSGAVVWNEGKLENSKLRVFLAPKNGPPSEFYGDQIIEASPEDIKSMDLSVQTIVYKM